jgi:hypothetical protein
MNTNREPVLALRNCRTCQTLIVYATALVFAAGWTPVLVGSVASAAGADRHAEHWVLMGGKYMPN